MISSIPRELPQSQASEAGVLASMIVEPRCIPEVLDILDETDFMWPEHRIIWNVVNELYAEEGPVAVDGLAVRRCLEMHKLLKEVGGWEYLQRMLQTVPSSANVHHYAQDVRQLAQRRLLIQVGRNLAEGGYDTTREIDMVVAEAERSLFTAAESRLTVQDAEPLGKIAKRVYTQIEKRKDRQYSGIPTGYHALDEILAGLHDGEMTIIAGRPSMGKTTLALNIAEHITGREGKPVLLFSLETDRGSLVERLLVGRANLDAQAVRQGRIKEGDYSKLMDAIEELGELPLYILDPSQLTPVTLRTKARQYTHSHAIEVVIIDYLGLMHAGSKHENRQQEVTTISRHIKGLGRELNLPVVALSQLNRQPTSRSDFRPRLSDLRESGSLEQDADVVLLIHREDAYHKGEEEYEPTNTAEIIVAKQRNGPTGSVKLTWREGQARFENMAVQGEFPEQ